MPDIHARTFNAVTLALGEAGWFIPLSVREAIAVAVEAEIEPEIRADEQERITREILAYETSCLRHADPLDGVGVCSHCAYSAGLHKGARVAFGLPYPVPLPEVRED